MSKYLQPALYKGKAVEQQWVNGIFNSHDLFCGCPDAIKHLADILQPKQLCLPSTSTEGDPGKDGGDAVDDLEPGVLETLFSEDFDDETG